MSRMSKFLRQKCWLEAYQVNEKGNPRTNRFGEYEYSAPYLCNCRRETTTKDVQTTNGSIVRATVVYYIDSSHPVKVGYKIDSQIVVSVKDYINAQGLNEGYEVYV